MGIEDNGEAEDFRSWLDYGISMGWVTDMFCNTHDGGPLTPEEDEAWTNGEDPCSFHIRVWE